MKIKKLLLGLLISSAFTTGLSSCGFKPSTSDPMNSIPIQHNGQIISFEAFSRQTLELIACKESLNGKPATWVMLDALGAQGSLSDQQWIRLNLGELKEHLSLPLDRSLFSYNEVMMHLDRVESLARNSQEKRDRDIRPSKIEQEAEALYGRLVTVKNLIVGKTITVVPLEDPDSAWLSPYLVPGALSDSFKNLVQLFHEGKIDAFKEEAAHWKASVHSLTTNRYTNKMDFEMRYFRTRPFQIAWVAYLFAFIFLGFFRTNKILRICGFSAVAIAVFFHTYGLALRILILERPPVSNMYESMIFMNWVLILGAGFFSFLKKNEIALVVGSVISALVMIYGDLLPIDTGLNVLVPVLRSNYWLTIHVMTIVASYGIFGLAMGLGHRHLILHVRGKLTHKAEQESAQLIHNAIQVGTLLLGIGTVLGGVWANESWGRFWGWDPKETWALITFLGYLIVIHLKYAKILKPFGLALSSVIGFLLVLMTWYGVNFVLGRGLHSYGQGSGGMIWVIAYLAAEVFFLTWVSFCPKPHPKKHKK